MKNKLTIALLTLTLFVASATTTTVRAQSYNKAIGLNLGTILGINFKHFVSSKGALEYNFGYQRPSNGVMLTAVYQHHINLVENLNLYVGGGLNMGVKDIDHRHNNSRFAIGIDPTIGFEYKFNEAPIALAMDYTPQINLTTSMNWQIIAFKVRFTL